MGGKQLITIPSVLRAMRHILLGYNQQFLPSTRTGPSGAWTLLCEQWKRLDSIGLVRFVRLLICVAIFFLPTIYMDLLYIAERAN